MHASSLNISYSGERHFPSTKHLDLNSNGDKHLPCTGVQVSETISINFKVLLSTSRENLPTRSLHPVARKALKGGTMTC